MEMGYGKNDDDILSNVLKLIEAGIVGINIEDSSVNSSGRVLKDVKTFTKTIEYIKNNLVSKKPGPLHQHPL